MSESEAGFFKTPEERLEVQPDEYFIGCFFFAGFGGHWATPAVQKPVLKQFGLAAIPYTQFLRIWGNILGYTGMPNREFMLRHLSRSPETLARQSIAPVDPATSQNTSLYEQASTLYLFSANNDDYNFGTFESNCPAQSLNDNFCNLSGQCEGSLETDSLTSNALIAMLLAFSALYTLLGAYWIQVFPCGVRIFVFVELSSRINSFCLCRSHGLHRRFQYFILVTPTHCQLILAHTYISHRMVPRSPFISPLCTDIGLGAQNRSERRLPRVEQECLWKTCPKSMDIRQRL